VMKLTLPRRAGSAGDIVLKRYFEILGRWREWMFLNWMIQNAWVMDLALPVDMTRQNIPNLKLQGSGSSTAAYGSVKASCKTSREKTHSQPHSTACISLVEEGTAFSGDECASAIENPLQEFDQRFADSSRAPCHFPAVCRPLLS